VDLVDGRTLVQPADERYRGGPDNPFTREDLREKFTDCAELVLPPAAITRAFEAVESLETLPDIADLIRVLASASTPSVAAR
jgi:hypothetical protein